MAIVVSGAGLPCYAFALAREHAIFRKRAAITAPLSLDVRGWRGPRGLVVETGIGAANVCRVLDLIAERFTPSQYIFAGFAGALRDELHVGDVRAASQVVADGGGRMQPTLALPSLQSATLYTSHRLIGEPAEKHRLGSECGAEMVDMESAHFAEWCIRRRRPWACVRVISDEADTRLSPALLSLISGGRVSACAIVKALARQPSLVSEMMKLGRDTSRAARSLAEALLQGT